MRGLEKVQAEERARKSAAAADDAAGPADAERHADCAEASVKAMEQARAAKAAEACRLAAKYFGYLVSEVGEEVARAAWSAAPPKRKRGYRVTEAKARADRLIAAMHAVNRELGMTPEQSAEHMQLPNDPRDAVRTIDRRAAKVKRAKSTLISE